LSWTAPGISGGGLDGTKEEDAKMEMFKWDDSYKVGVAEIDDQHKRLVGYVNELFDAMKSGKGKDVLGKILSSLINYTRVHFQTEEGLMMKHSYPEYTAHKKEHDALTDKVVALNKDFAEGKMVMTVDVGTFLKDWLVNHIQKTDKKYTQFFNAKGVK